MEASNVRALAALAGSAIGAVASITTTWISQDSQARAIQLKQDRARREASYGEFIRGASKLFGDIVRAGELDPCAHSAMPAGTSCDPADPETDEIVCCEVLMSHRRLSPRHGHEYPATETMMTHRVDNPYKSAPDAIKAMMAVEAAIRASGLDHILLTLVKMRASQINGCAFCIHMHATEARAAGESEMRLYLLDAWRESTLYSDRERAALAWTEALTRLAETGAPDVDYDLIRQSFTEMEQVNLTLAIGAINLWNRLQVGLHGQHAKAPTLDAA